MLSSNTWTTAQGFSDVLGGII